MISSSVRQSKYFWRYRDGNKEDCQKFGTNSIAWNEITMNFGSQKLVWSYVVQYLESSNSHHSRTAFPLCHYFKTCVMTLLVPTLKRRKKHIPSFHWKSVPTLVGNNHMLVVQVWYGNGWSYLTYLTPFVHHLLTTEISWSALIEIPLPLVHNILINSRPR